MRHRLQPGEPVIYSAQKCTTHPGPRAKMISPAEHGDYCQYIVHKFWRVKGVRDDGKVTLVTRRGKIRVCDESDQRLRRPSLITRLIYRHRFPEPLS